MNSCVYVGRVRHRRFAPRPHEFSYALFMLALDLDELDTVFRGRWFWSTRRFAPAWFRRADHFGDPRQSLADSVRDLVQRKTGRRPAGAIRLVTHLRYFGYCFNPVSFFYCYDRNGDGVEAVVAEVNNTPWGERHCYVLHGGTLAANTLEYTQPKQFHVSPFMAMDMRYRLRFTEPGELLRVHMENHTGDGKLFDATLTMKRREISGGSLAAMLVRYPFMTAQVVGGIYWQALRLWLKGTPRHSNPNKEALRSAER